MAASTAGENSLRVEKYMEKVKWTIHSDGFSRGQATLPI